MCSFLSTSRYFCFVVLFMVGTPIGTIAVSILYTLDSRLSSSILLKYMQPLIIPILYDMSGRWIARLYIVPMEYLYQQAAYCPVCLNRTGRALSGGHRSAPLVYSVSGGCVMCLERFSEKIFFKIFRPYINRLYYYNRYNTEVLSGKAFRGCGFERASLGIIAWKKCSRPF